MMRLLRKALRAMRLLWHLSVKKGILSIVIVLLMGINRFVILFIPFKKIAPKLGTSQVVADGDITEQQGHRIVVVGSLIRYFAQKTPWESKCFVQALTATELLMILRVPSTLYFGLKREDGGLKAHAWVKVNDVIVTGGGHEDFQVVAFYGSE